jgi:F1F0 ATPase subunit 2
MAPAISVPLLLLAGFGLGGLFYGGLWVTVRALPKSQHPAILALGSFWARGAVVIAGFILLTAGSWQNALVCLAGFVLARIVLARWIPHDATGKGVG